MSYHQELGILLDIVIQVKVGTGNQESQHTIL
jgi:hypothetical protein